MAKKAENPEVVIDAPKSEVISVWIVGTSPMLHHAMSAKATGELLFPKGRKNAAEKRSTLKHDVPQEFRQSVYLREQYMNVSSYETAIVMPAPAPKKALMGAALDLPGSSKAQMGRLIWIKGTHIPIYGIPQVHMAPVRNSDTNRTPDIRTRAVMGSWAANITIEFITPLLKAKSVINALAAGGMTQGLGDWRQEKGSGNYGLFRVCNPDDAELKDILATGNLKAQVAAMNDPQCFDEQSERYWNYWHEELRTRGMTKMAVKLPRLRLTDFRKLRAVQ